MDLEQRITEVETRLAFQETTLQELNTALTDQQQQLNQLQGLLKKINEQLIEVISRNQPNTINEPPPHY